jgi:membrane protein
MTTERSSTQQRIGAARDRVTTTRDRAQRTILWQVWERMLEIEFVDRSVALAGKAFVSFFPLVIVVAAFVPPHTRQSIFSTLTHRLGMHGAALATAKQAFASASDVRRATGILGLLMTFFFASSFTSAVQRVYLRAWRRAPAGKVSGYTRGPIWLAALLVYMALLGGIRGLLGNGIGLGGFALLALVMSSALWWFTAWFLLLGEVRWRVLLPSGLITGIALSGYALSANIWMPNVVQSNQSQFGFFGVALALVTWFSGASVCVIVGACAGPVFAEDEGFIGKLVRGSEPDLLVPGAAAPLPAPTRQLRIRDAFRSDQEEADETPPAAGGPS